MTSPPRRRRKHTAAAAAPPPSSDPPPFPAFTLAGDVGFSSMAVGEKAILVIDSEMGYGARGAGGKIPGGATLLFEVQLLSYTGARKEL